MLLLLLLTLLGMADPTTNLAPTVGEVRDRVDVLEARLIDADALGEAVARVHNAWAERTGPPDRTIPCDHPAAELATRSERFGVPWRDAVQLARNALAHVEQGAALPTAAPLLDERFRARVAVLRERVRRHERAVVEASTWHSRYLASFLRRCKPTAVRAVGLPRTEIRAEGEVAPQGVAIAVLSGSRVCGAGVVAIEGPAVVVLDEPHACYGDCGCPSEGVEPGAVLGETKDP